MKQAMWVVLWACALLVLPVGAQAGSISGRVTGPWGVFPLEGILVESLDRKFIAPMASTTTAPDGTYVLEDLAEEGDWRVTFTDTNNIYMPEVYDNFLNYVFPPVVGTTIVVPSVGTVSNISTALYGYPSITGRVTRVDGTTPLENVWVHLFRLDGSCYETNGGCFTDANGNYKRDHLWPGTYRVTFEDSTGVYTPEVYDGFPGTDYQNYGSEVVLVANHDATDVSASLSLQSMIAGTVTGPDGATPMPGVRVTAYREIGTNWIGVDSNLTDADGGYEVGPLAAWTHRVGFDDRTGNYTDEFFDNAPDLASGTDVDVPEGEVLTVDASLADARDSAISGTVTNFLGYPLAGIVVETSNVVAEMSGLWTTTGTNGAYTVGVAAGTYRVRFRDTNGFFIGEVYDNVVGDDFSLGANVGALAFKTAIVNASLDVFSTISGMVNGPDGATPLAGIVVESINVTTGASGPSTVTAANGLYTIRGLLAGLYRVRFRDEGGVYIGEVYNNVYGDEFGRGVNINVVTGMGLVGINASLEKRPVVTSFLPQETSGNYQILSAGPTNMSYILQEASSPTSGWADVGTSLPAPTGTGIWSRTMSATQTFWRVQMLLPY
ncbi:MAG: carboxypeptidase regulatory-like domain-containing protein [Spartobacteria bacterium]|nr:carboxypeptidase regulatory-like domain-containing protein [Spartobacteria bacterium]